jgi:tetratricopeptide (TPR) repeat protein
MAILAMSSNHGQDARATTDRPRRNLQGKRRMGFVVMLSLMTTAPALHEAHQEAVTRFGLGVYYARQNRLTSAQAEFGKAAKLEPDSLDLLREQLALQMKFGRHAAAVRLAKTILTRDPADIATAHTLGQLLHEGRNPAEATKVLLTAAGRPEANPRRRLSLYEDAFTSAKAAKDSKSQAEAARGAIDTLTRHQPELLGGPRLEDAAAFTRQLARKHDQLGDALLALDDFDGAEKAYRLGTPAATDWQRAGLLLKLDRRNEARILLENWLPKYGRELVHFDRYTQTLPAESRVDALTRLRRGMQTPAALEWIIARERLATDRDRALRDLETLASDTAEPAFYQLLVKAYVETESTSMMLRHLDREATAAHAPPESRSPLALERYRAFVDALKSSQAIPNRVLETWATTTDLHDDLQDLLSFLCERWNATKVQEQALRDRAARLPNDDNEKALYFFYTGQRRWREALQIAERAGLQQNRQGGNRFIIWSYYKALPLLELGRGYEALGALAIAEQDTSSPFSVQLERAHFYVLLDKPKEAIDLANKVLAKNTEARVVHQAKLRLGEAYNALKQYDKADAIFESLLDDDPDDVLVLNNFAYNLADQGRRLAEAEEMLRRAVELDEYEQRRLGKADLARGTYLDSLGWALFRRGKLDEAKALLERAKRSTDSANDAVVWDHAGDLHFRRKEYDEARAAWTRAAELYDGTHQGRQHDRRETVLTKLKQIP